MGFFSDWLREYNDILRRNPEAKCEPDRFLTYRDYDEAVNVQLGDLGNAITPKLAKILDAATE